MKRIRTTKAAPKRKLTAEERVRKPSEPNADYRWTPPRTGRMRCADGVVREVVEIDCSSYIEADYRNRLIDARKN